MGYRSDVALALTGETLAAFKRKLTELPDSTRKEIEPLFTEWFEKRLTEDNCECWFWKDIKWYTCWPEHYPDIDFVENFLGEAQEEESYFVRVGEEYDDNEIRGLWLDNPFGLTLCREVVLDC